jgi:ADP-heptose:LPS heptosyltransferase
MKTAPNILVYRLGSLGDTIVALPCFHLIKRAFPGARLTLLTNLPVASKAAAVEAILGKDFFDEVLAYPVGIRGPKPIFELLGQLRRRRFDTLVHLAAFRGRKQSLRDAIFFRLAGVRRIYGLSFTEKGDAPSGGLQMPEYRRLADRLKALGDARVEDEASWDLHLTAEEASRAAELLDGLTGAPLIAVSCGTKWRTNDWEEENWAQLLDALALENPGATLVLLGAQEEIERSVRMAAAWGGETRNLCGRASPRVSAAVLKRASLFIGHDSGPLHLAACVGIPCIGIFSARNAPGRWFPRGERTRVIYRQSACFGCGLELCETEGKKCILGITVADVLALARDLLNPSGPHSSRYAGVRLLPSEVSSVCP